MVDQILSNGVMAVHGEGNLQLRPDAVNACDEDRLSDSFEVRPIESTERTNVRQYIRCKGGANPAFDASHEFLSSLNINARIFIGLHHSIRNLTARYQFFAR
jgi:hypothetical protein